MKISLPKSNTSFAFLLFGVAVAIRLLHMSSIQHLFVFQNMVEDSFYFDSYAWKIASGMSKEMPLIASLAPVYLAFLSACYSIFGHEPVAARLLQILLGSGSCVLIYRMTAKIWDEKTGRLAGAISACYGVFIFYDIEIFKPCLANFLVILSFYLFLEAAEKRKAWLWIGAAFFMSSAALLRMQLMLFAPALIVWVLWIHVRDKRINAVIASGLVLAGLTVGMWVWPAWLDHAAPLQRAPLAEAGIQFYIGNQPLAEGTYRAVEGIPHNATGHTHGARKVAEEVLSKELTDHEVDLFWFKRGCSAIAKDPSGWIGLEIRKLLLMVNAYEIPSSDSYGYQRSQSWVLQLPLPQFALIAPFGLLGLLLFRRKGHAGEMLLILFLASYGIALMATYVIGQYRFPIQFPLLMFASHAMIVSAEAFLKNDRVFIKKILIFFIPLYLLTNHQPLLNKHQHESFPHMRFEQYQRDFNTPRDPRRRSSELLNDSRPLRSKR